MSNLISAGIFRLFHSAAFRVFCIYSAACGVLSAVWNFLKMPEAGQEYSIFSFAIFIPMFSAPFTAVILGGEFSDSTVRNKIISGRTKTYAEFALLFVAGILSTVTVTVLTAVITLCTHSRAAAAAVCTVAVCS